MASEREGAPRRPTGPKKPLDGGLPGPVLFWRSAPVHVFPSISRRHFRSRHAPLHSPKRVQKLPPQTVLYPKSQTYFFFILWTPIGLTRACQNKYLLLFNNKRLPIVVLFCQLIFLRTVKVSFVSVECPGRRDSSVLVVDRKFVSTTWSAVRRPA